MKIKLFEMFAGYGGASFALKNAGIDFECVGYSEINKDAIKIFELNHPNIKNFGDCTKIKPKELPDFDLLTAGFPCQPFSVNTNINKRGEKHKDSNLFESIINILEIKKPRFFVLENVKGILGLKSKPIMDKIISEINRVGYNLEIKMVNSKDYGTPQNRERVLFIGVDKNFPMKLNFPKKENLKICVKDILEEKVNRREPKLKNLKLSKEKNIKIYGEINRFEAVLKCPVKKRNSNVLFEILDAPSNVVSRQSDRIYEPTYSPCLTATGSDYLFYIDGKVIVLTPRECFRLMGFFKDEINFGDLNDNSLHKLAGNGWDINLFTKIFNYFFKEIKEEKPSVVKNDSYEEILNISSLNLKKEYKLILIKEIIKNNEMSKM